MTKIPNNNPKTIISLLNKIVNSNKKYLPKGKQNKSTLNLGSQFRAIFIQPEKNPLYRKTVLKIKSSRNIKNINKATSLHTQEE